MTKNDSLSKVSKDLILRNPFYGLFLLMLNKQWNYKDVPTAAVGRNGIGFQLYINEEFWMKLSEDHKAGLLQHELMHIGFGHLTEFSHMTEHKVANIAMDLEINQMIPAQYLPPNGQKLELYPELNLLPNKGSNYYYDELMKAKNNNSCPNLNKMLAGPGEGQIMIRVSISGPGGKGTREIDVIYDPHAPWKEMEGLSEAEKKLVQKQVEHILNEVAQQVVKSRGTIPGEFAEIIHRIQNPDPPKFDWRGYLRRFVGGSNKTITRKTRRKESKRYAGNPALKIKRKRRILVGIDTSGSVSTTELKEFVGELWHINKTGTEIRVAQCDSAFRGVSDFKPKEEFKVLGRGGTDFTPIVDYFNEHKDEFACLIYCTDGEAPAPDNKPQGRILWVLSSKSNINPALPGPQIKLN